MRREWFLWMLFVQLRIASGKNLREEHPDVSFGELMTLVAQRECRRMRLHAIESAPKMWMNMFNLSDTYFGYGC
jgi:hypothetical protein